MTGRYGHYLPPYFNDRRRGKERRKFLYTIHIPERRTKEERRLASERRNGKERRIGSERRKTQRQMINKPEMRDKSTDRNIMLE